MRELYFAGGCFWGLERFFGLVDGVLDHEVGYANGPTDTIGYEQVCEGSGHAETVRVIFDDRIISAKGLITLFFSVIDPFTLNRQGNDRGIQYRTGIYGENIQDVEEIQGIVSEITRGFSKPCMVEVGLLRNYCTGEEYHQEYLLKHPSGYCHINQQDFERAKTYREQK